MNRLKSVEFWCLLLLIVNAVTAGADFYFRRSAAASLPLAPGQMISGTPGITANGSPPAPGAACHLVRYASINCGYCAPKYSQAWNDLEKALTRRGCDAIIVSPYATDLPPGDGATPEQRLAGVSLQFMKSTRFTSTPIMLLVDRDWRILWSHVGVLENRDYQQAMRAAGF
ncbi:MAG: hypothetical protein ACHP79_17130 [Terriglobales bacterium]